jgi:hypothetical protein
VQYPAPGERASGAGYPGSTVLAALVATFCFPVLSLIAALLLYGREPDPAKRASLRSWALVSAGWIVIQIIAAVLLFAAFVSATGATDMSGPCQGGPQIGVAGEVQNDGTTVFPCEFGGSATVTLP